MAKTRNILLYLLALALFAAGVWGILGVGSRFSPAATILAASPARSAGVDNVFHHPLPLLLCQLALVVAAAGVCGRLARRLGQPAVIGEMAAGIALGPSLLGHFFPACEGFLFPPASLGNLGLISQIGVVLFMFSVGMEIDLGQVRRHARMAMFVSLSGIVLPFLLGMGAALWLFSRHAPSGVSFTPFALFLGIAMSITAFPVLARILAERGLSATPLGATAMASAAVDDVTAWTLLAAVITVARAQSPLSALGIAAAAAAFTAAMLYGVRPLARRLIPAALLAKPGRGLVSLVLVCVFLSSLATEAIGIHSLFGAFLAGVVMPAHQGFRTFLRDRLEYSASLFLLPVFFAATGLRTRIDLIGNGADWLQCGALFFLAVAGKFGGVGLAARANGAGWREAFSLGALMNTRGLMELIVLNVGLDLGILSQGLFTMMVLVALATTMMTGPLLALIAKAPSRKPGVPETAALSV